MPREVMRLISLVSIPFLALLVLAPHHAAAQVVPRVFEGTVTALEISGYGCGYNVFAGVFRVDVDRMISGEAVQGEVRVVAACTTPRPGQRIRFTALPMHGNRSPSGRSFQLHGRMPHDAVPVFEAREMRDPAPP